MRGRARAALGVATGCACVHACMRQGRGSACLRSRQISVVHRSLVEQHTAGQAGGGSNRPAASKAAVARLPVVTLDSAAALESVGGPSTACPVCTEDYSANGGKVQRLPCKHVFHVDCLAPWLQQVGGLSGSCGGGRGALSAQAAAGSHVPRLPCAAHTGQLVPRVPAGAADRRPPVREPEGAGGARGRGPARRRQRAVAQRVHVDLSAPCWRHCNTCHCAWPA